MLEWTATVCETFLDSAERLTLRIPLASFRRLLYCLPSLNFWSSFQNRLCNQSECLCHPFYFIQGTSTINDKENYIQFFLQLADTVGAKTFVR